MILFIVLLFLLFIAAFYGTTREDQALMRLDEGQAMARQLVIQHAAAVQRCSTSGPCVVGWIDTADTLPTTFRGNPPFVARIGEPLPRLRSYYTGDFIVTAYADINSDPQLARYTYGHIQGQIFTALKPIYRCGIGRWDAAGSAVVIRGYAQTGTGAPATPGIGSIVVPVPGFPGVNDGTPTLVSKTQGGVSCGF